MSDPIKALADTWDDYSRRWEEKYPGLPYLGAQWVGVPFPEWITKEYVSPYVTRESVIVEVGCGGGKFTQYLAPLCRKVIALDVSPAMIHRARKYLNSREIYNVFYRVGDGHSFAGIEPPVDVIFSYDVFLHLPIELVYSYLLDGWRVLREGGIFILHQANILYHEAPKRIEYQAREEYWRHPLGHPDTIARQFFTSPEASKVLAGRIGYTVAKEGSMLERDILLALRKGVER